MTSTVLVLDGVSGTRDLFVEALEDEGFLALGAESPEEALHVSKSFSLQVAVCHGLAAGDVRLRLFDILRERHPQIRMILIGKSVDPALLREGDEALSPPVHPEQMLKAVKRKRSTRAGNLLAALMKVPRKLLDKADALRRDQAQELLERERSRVFQGLHVAIWSNLLTVDAGLDVWDRIAELEEIMARYRDLPATPTSELVELAQRYEALFNLMTAMAQSRAVGAFRHRHAGEVDRVRLQCLFERVKDGYVSRDLLHRSWIVWKAQEQNDDFARCWDPEADLPSPRARKKPKEPPAHARPAPRKPKRDMAAKITLPPVSPGQIALGAPVGQEYVIGRPEETKPPSS